MATVGFAGTRLVAPRPGPPPPASPHPDAVAASARDRLLADLTRAHAARPDAAVADLQRFDASLAVHLADLVRGEPFDAVVLSEGLDPLEDSQPVLQAVGRSLVPGSGRLILVQPRLDERFTADEFGADFSRAWQRGASTAAPALHALRNAVWQRLRPGTQAGLAQVATGDLPEATRVALAADFDALLGDRGFVPAVNAALGAAGSGVAQELTSDLTMAQATVLQWVVLHFDDHGLFDADGPPLLPLPQAALQTVNAIALSPLFGPRGRPLPGAAAGMALSEAGVVRRLARSGYRRVPGPVTSASHLVLVFARDASAGARP